jgi:TolA-binding protein
MSAAFGSKPAVKDEVSEMQVSVVLLLLLWNGADASARDTSNDNPPQNAKREWQEYDAFQAGAALQRNGQFEKAAARWAKFLDAYPSSSHTPEAMLNRAECLVRLGQKKAAADLYAAWLTKFSDQKLAPNVLYAQGVAQDEAKLPEAGKTYDQFLEKFPDHPLAAEVMLRRAGLFSRAKNDVQAERLLGQWIANHPSDPKVGTWQKHQAAAIYRLAEAAFDRRDFAKATMFYRQMLDIAPKGPLAPNALYGLGWTDLSQSRFAEAAKTLDALVKEYPDNALIPRARYARAIARYQQKQFADAVEDLQALLATNPQAAERSDARYLLGLCEAGLKKHAAAVADFQAILTDDPQYIGADKALYELAWAQTQEGRSKDAGRTFGRLATEYPDSPLAVESQFRAAEAAFYAGDFNKAAHAYHAVWRAAGKNRLAETAVYKLGWCYLRSDDWADAQQTFNYLRTTWPESSLADLATLMEGESLLRLRKTDAALAIYGKLIANPNSETAAKAYFQIGRVQFEQKKYFDAQKTFLKVVYGYDDPPLQAQAAYQVGRCFEAMGQKENALEEYRELVQKFPESDVAPRAKR